MARFTFKCCSLFPLSFSFSVALFLDSFFFDGFLSTELFLSASEASYTMGKCRGWGFCVPVSCFTISKHVGIRAWNRIKRVMSDKLGRYYTEECEIHEEKITGNEGYHL